MSSTAGSIAGLGDGDSAGEPTVSGGTAGFGGSLGEAGSPDAGGTTAGGMPAGGAAAGASAGRGGMGGTTGSGGTSAGAGGAAAGAAGANPAATGCAKLTIPIDASTDKAHFVIALTSAIDMSAAVVSTRLYVLAGAGGTILNYVQDSGTYHFLGVPMAQRTLLGSLVGWSTLAWNVGTEPDAGTNIVKTSIKNLGIEVNAHPSTAWSNPTVIYIDSITVSTPTVTSTFTFDASASVSPTPTTSSASGQALWVNSGTTDTTATGVAAAWQATCP